MSFLRLAAGSLAGAGRAAGVALCETAAPPKTDETALCRRSMVWLSTNATTCSTKEWTISSISTLAFCMVLEGTCGKAELATTSDDDLVAAEPTAIPGPRLTITFARSSSPTFPLVRKRLDSLAPLGALSVTKDDKGRDACRTAKPSEPEICCIGLNIRSRALAGRCAREFSSVRSTEFVSSWQNRRATLAGNCRKGRGEIRWTATPRSSDPERRGDAFSASLAAAIR